MCTPNRGMHIRTSHSAPLAPIRAVFWEGDATKHFSVKKGACSEKGGGNSVNEGFGKDVYRKGNSVKRFEPFSEPLDSKTQSVAILAQGKQMGLLVWLPSPGYPQCVLKVCSLPGALCSVCVVLVLCVRCPLRVCLLCALSVFCLSLCPQTRQGWAGDMGRNFAVLLEILKIDGCWRAMGRRRAHCTKERMGMICGRSYVPLLRCVKKLTAWHFAV